MERSAGIEAERGARRGRAGFTLIEVMIAMTVLSLGLFAVIQLQVVSVRGNAYARERTEAYEIALGVAEEMRIQSLRWRPGSNFATVFYAAPYIPVANLPPPPPPPPAGSDIPAGQMAAFPVYSNQIIGAALASNINLFGTVGGQRAVYRVHYAMHQVSPAPGQPADPRLVRVTVFVSWDNKDHGLQTGAWDPSVDPAADPTFWNRHMNAITFYLAQVLF